MSPQPLDPVFDSDGNLTGKRCRKCLVVLPLSYYYVGGHHPNGRSVCKHCYSLRFQSAYAKQSQERKDPAFRAKYILKDALSMDHRRGLECDLTLEWVEAAIKNGCSYCGETTIRMSLDRIDNDLGHTTANVRPACTRCNFLRGTMPYEAWLYLTPRVREAREKGLFGEWSGAISTWKGGRRMAAGIKQSRRSDPWEGWPSGEVSQSSRHQ